MIRLDQLPHPEYLPYPNRYTAAFFKNVEDAEKAVDELEAYGYDEEDFNVFQGTTGVEAVDVDGLHHTLLENFMRKFIKFSDSAEWRFLNEADRELRNGHVMICVLTLDDDQKDEIVDTFKTSGAYDIRYFTPLYVEEIL
ncbi:MAG: hypothetical protein ACXVCP_17060 [Bdellovibrio sp.]